MPLKVIRQIFPDAGRFVSGLCGLLECGEVRLRDEGNAIPSWQWRKMLTADPLPPNLFVSLTAAGTQRIG